MALMAMMFATIAFSIDALLPAQTAIALELTPENTNRAQLILICFVLGMGLGTLVVGPISDAIGRRRTMFGGAALYIVGASVAWASDSFEVILAARFVQGIGAAGPRVVCIAIIRDLFSGREMAKLVSIILMVFTLVPAFAPAMGAVIIEVAGWRSIFGAFVVFSAITVIWLACRLPETLPVEDRRPLQLSVLTQSVAEILGHPLVRLSILVQSLAMGMLFSVLIVVEPIYDQVYDKLANFPYWFGGIALFSATASILNAMLVVRLGMRLLVASALALQVVLSGAVLVSHFYLGSTSFVVFAVWQAFVFFQAGLTIGNLNALAMEPMGHIAGTAASVIGAIATILAGLFAAAVGVFFDGTVIPLIGSIFGLACVASFLMLFMRRMEKEAQPTA